MITEPRKAVAIEAPTHRLMLRLKKKMQRESKFARVTNATAVHYALTVALEQGKSIIRPRGGMKILIVHMRYSPKGYRFFHGLNAEGAS